MRCDVFSYFSFLPANARRATIKSQWYLCCSLCTSLPVRFYFCCSLHSLSISMDSLGILGNQLLMDFEPFLYNGKIGMAPNNWFEWPCVVTCSRSRDTASHHSALVARSIVIVGAMGGLVTDGSTELGSFSVAPGFGVRVRVKRVRFTVEPRVG